jgi:hypothetical protein
MTIQTSTRTHNTWQDSRLIISAAPAQPKRPARTEQPRSATEMQVPTEKEADRWVAAMMFDHYNG